MSIESEIPDADRSVIDPFQREFWNDYALDSSFSHPVATDWLDRYVAFDARILDFGCGYGRSLELLLSLGYRNLVGVDTSAAMIRRARKDVPNVEFDLLTELPSRLEEGSFDAILLVAVLTCIPSDEAQQAVIAETERLLRPGGFLHVSDLPLQTSGRYDERYGRAPGFENREGVFTTLGGRVVMRHHTFDYLKSLLRCFEAVKQRRRPIRTMNGNPAEAVQYLMRKPR